jgi:hypothetical protein
MKLLSNGLNCQVFIVTAMLYGYITYPRGPTKRMPWRMLGVTLSDRSVKIRGISGRPECFFTAKSVLLF